MGTNHIIHHSIGRSDGTSQEIEAFRPFVCDAARCPAPCSPHGRREAQSAWRPLARAECSVCLAVPGMCRAGGLAAHEEQMAALHSWRARVQVQVFSLSDAHEQVDHAIAMAVRARSTPTQHMAGPAAGS